MFAAVKPRCTWFSPRNRKLQLQMHGSPRDLTTLPMHDGHEVWLISGEKRVDFSDSGRNNRLLLVPVANCSLLGPRCSWTPLPPLRLPNALGRVDLVYNPRTSYSTCKKQSTRQIRPCYNCIRNQNTRSRPYFTLWRYLCYSIVFRSPGSGVWWKVCKCCIRQKQCIWGTMHACLKFLICWCPLLNVFLQIILL